MRLLSKDDIFVDSYCHHCWMVYPRLPSDRDVFVDNHCPYHRRWTVYPCLPSEGSQSAASPRSASLPSSSGRPALDQALNEVVPGAVVPVLAVEERPPTGIDGAACIGPFDRIPMLDVCYLVRMYVRIYGVYLASYSVIFATGPVTKKR